MALIIDMQCVYAQSDSQPLTQAALIPQKNENGLQERFLRFEITRNFPIGNGENNFTPHQAHPLIGYSFMLKNSWLLGISAQFKFLGLKEHASSAAETEDTAQDSKKKHLALWTLAHETYWLERLYHPTYFFSGPKIFYMSPVQAGVLPFAREPDWDQEFGAGWAAGILHKVGAHWIILRLERWRGINTQAFQGIETSIGVAF